MTKSIRTVLTPFLIINYVLGLRIVEFPAGYSKPWLSLLYILLLWSIYYYFMYSTTMFYMNLYSSLHHICHWLNNFTTLLSIIIGMYHDKKFRQCLKKLAIVDVTLERLGTTIDYQQTYRKTVWLALGWFVTAILINCVHALYIKNLQYNFDITTIICISIITNYCSHLNLIEDLIIASILGYIGLKFDQINEHLQNLTSNNKQAIKQAWENTLLDSPKCTLPKTSKRKRTIWTIMQLHLELCKISREIDSIFGIQMTFKMGCYFGFMAMNLSEIFNVIFIKNYIANHIKIFICIQVTWFSHNVLKLLLVNYMYEKVCTKANATKTFANRVLYSTCNVEINENISQLLLQMAQSPLKFYGLGLFQFGFKFLYGFTTSVTTVVVILIQAHSNK